MEEIVLNIITLLIGLTIFIVAMNMMSSGLKKSTGKGLKRIFRKTANNRFIGLGIGTSVTALIQSSAATSVLVVGFLNAGVMTLFQGISIIMGSNIGTTITGILVSLNSFPISKYFSILAFIGLILIFFKKEKVHNIGEILCGLGLIFFGLTTISSAFSGDDNAIKLAFQNLFVRFDFPLLVILLGAIFTALVQSSSAASGVVIVLVGSNAISFTTGMYLIVGATVGTWFTTFVASIGGNINAKRACYASLIIKSITAIVGLSIIWPIESLTQGISKFFTTAFPTEELSTAMFFVLYNTIGMLLLLPFIKPIEKLTILLVRDKKAEEHKRRLKYIDNRMLNTPSVAMMLTKKEIINMFDLARTNVNICYKEIKNLTFESTGVIEDIEETIDYVNNAITNFLINLSNKVSLEDEQKIGSYFHIINDIERIGDHAFNFHDMAKKIVEEDLGFSDTAKNELDQLFNVVYQMFDVAEKCFESHNMADVEDLERLESESDRLKVVLSSKHFERLSNGSCDLRMSPYYSSLVSELERISDHLFNIGFAFINPTGDDSKNLINL